MKVLFVLVFSVFLASCEYQESVTLNNTDTLTPALGGNGSPLPPATENQEDLKVFDKSWLESYELTQDKAMSENMNAFLSIFVSKIQEEPLDTEVNYLELSKSKNSKAIRNLRGDLYKQIYEFSTADKTQAEIAAFYMNAYNFLVIETVVHYFDQLEGTMETSSLGLPVRRANIKSIANIGGAGSFSAFSNIKFFVSKTDISLDHLEKTLLKNALRSKSDPSKLDARFHFAVVCAARGCPALSTEAFLAEDLDAQLDSLTKSALRHEKNFKVVEGKQSMTSLFFWYGNDFNSHESIGGKKSRSVIEFLNKYQDVEVTMAPSEIFYEWALNEKK